MENVNPVVEVEFVLAPFSSENKVGDQVFSVRRTMMYDPGQMVALSTLSLLVNLQAISCNEAIWYLELASGIAEIERREITYQDIQVEVMSQGRTILVFAISRNQALDGILYAKIQEGGYIDVDTVPVSMNPGSDMND